jgi:hypothetical protein
MNNNKPTGSYIPMTTEEVEMVKQEFWDVLRSGDENRAKTEGPELIRQLIDNQILTELLEMVDKKHKDE